MTADSKVLLTVQEQIFQNVFVVDVPETPGPALEAGLKQITSEQENGEWLSWTADGKLLVADAIGRAYLMDADGSHQVPLLEREPAVAFPTGCGRADMAVVGLVRERSSALSLYKLNLSSGELKRLTSDTGDTEPSCTPDGKWVVYKSSSGGADHIMKVSSDGGTPVELASGAFFHSHISPDGRLVVYGRLVGPFQVAILCSLRTSILSHCWSTRPLGRATARNWPSRVGDATPRTR